MIPFDPSLESSSLPVLDLRALDFFQRLQGSEKMSRLAENLHFKAQLGALCGS